ncbi:MAG: hypothetical protein AAF693_19205 [Bacteroidota bacterium]
MIKIIMLQGSQFHGITKDRWSLKTLEGSHGNEERMPGESLSFQNT